MAKKDEYKLFLDDDEEDFDEYIKDMKLGGTWGSQLEINAMANVLRFNVVVH